MANRCGKSYNSIICNEGHSVNGVLYFRQLLRKWRIGMLWVGNAYRLSDISDKPIYRPFFRYRLSYRIDVENGKILDIGHWHNKNIGYRMDSVQCGISVHVGYRISTEIKYRISAGRKQFEISDIGYQLQSNIGYRISARNQPIAFPRYEL